MEILKELYEKNGLEGLEKLKLSIEENENFLDVLNNFLNRKKELFNYSVEEFLNYLSKLKKIVPQENDVEKDYSKEYEIDVIKEILISKHKKINSFLVSLNYKSENLKEVEYFKFKILENIMYLFDKDGLREIFKFLKFENFNGENNIAFFLANGYVLTKGLWINSRF